MVHIVVTHPGMQGRCDTTYGMVLRILLLLVLTIGHTTTGYHGTIGMSGRTSTTTAPVMVEVSLRVSHVVHA